MTNTSYLRVRDFTKRNKGRLARAFWSEVSIRAYRSEYIRTVIRPFIRHREPEKWIFLVGCYNSGTTITREILGAHPDIRILPCEGVRFTSLLTRPEDLGWTRMWNQCIDYMAMPPGKHPALTQRIIEDWSPWWGKGGRAFLEKSIANVTRMRWLDENFSNAYFIGIIRNGYCVAEGICRKARPKKEAARKIGSRYPIKMAGAQWVSANKMLMEGGEQVKRYYQITYEDFIAEPVQTLNNIWQFLNLDKPPTEFDGESVNVLDRSFLLKNMNKESLARLTKDDFLDVNTVLAEMQNSLGYEVLR